MDKKFFAKDFISPGRKKAKKNVLGRERARENVFIFIIVI